MRCRFIEFRKQNVSKFPKTGQKLPYFTSFCPLFNGVGLCSSVHIELFSRQREARKKAYHGVEAVNHVSKIMICKKIRTFAAQFKSTLITIIH